MTRALQAIITLGMLLVASSATGQITRSDADAQGSALGSQILGTVQGSATSPNLNNVPGYQTSSPPETQYNHTNMYDAGTADYPNDPAGPMIGDSFTNRPAVNLNKSDPSLQPGWNVTEDPYRVVDQFTGKFQDCNPDSQGQVPGATEYRTCNVWADFTRDACPVGRDVEVQQNYLYTCNDGRKLESVTCQKVLTVTINGGPAQCSPGVYFVNAATACGSWCSSTTFYYRVWCNDANTLAVQWYSTCGGSSAPSYVPIGSSRSNFVRVYCGGIDFYWYLNASPNGSGGYNYSAYTSYGVWGARWSSFPNISQSFGIATSFTTSDSWTDQCSAYQ